LEGQWWLASCNNPPFSRYLHEATVWGAKLFIFFGVDASYNLLADIWSYDPGTNTWTEQPSTGDVPPPRAMFAAASLGEYIYVYGGLNNYGLPGDGDMWRYTPGTGAWQRGAALTPTRYNHLMFAINGKLVVRGGETGGVVPNNVPVYDPATDTWTEATLTGATPTKASEQAGAADGARLFTYGGTTAGCLAVSGAGVRPAVGGEIDEVWEFEFNSEVTTAVVRQLADLPAARTQAAAATLPVTGSQAAALSAAGHPQVLLFGGKNAQGQRVADTLLYSTGLYTWAGGTDSD
jgi:N-acetylneuraminic acid mutarotase